MRRSPDGWFTITEMAAQTFALTESLGQVDRFGPVLTHSYLLLGNAQAALVDASHGIGDLRGAVATITRLPVKVLLTHYHFDHIGCAHQFDSVAISELEAHLVSGQQTPEMQAATARVAERCRQPLPPNFSFDRYAIGPVALTGRLHDGDLIDLGGRVLQVVHTPGHSPGSVCFWDAGAGLMFGGDTFNRGLITMSLELCDIEAYQSSLDRLISALPAATASLLPAHYATPVGTDTLAGLAAGIAQVRAGSATVVDAGLWRQADFDWFSVALPALVAPSSGAAADH